jgi:hypothetical protein
VISQNLQSVPVDQVHLDTQNPRIRKWIEMYGDNPTPEQIYLALGAGSTDADSTSTTFSALKESIRTHGGLITPIIANRYADGRLVVVEGNTRLAIFRTFLEDKVPGQWDVIPTIVHTNLEQIGIDAIRLQAHLVGPRPWDPYSKAKYLHSLRNEYQVEFSKLVDLCGGKKRELQDYMDAYNDMETHYRKVIPDDSAFDPSRFSAFVEVQKPVIRKAISDAGYSLDDFATWVHERLIDPLATVRSLPAILSYPPAREVFLKHGAKEAMKLLYQPTPPAAGELSLEQLCQALVEKLGKLSHKEMKKMKDEPTSSVVIQLLEAQTAINDTCSDMAES